MSPSGSKQHLKHITLWSNISILSIMSNSYGSSVIVNSDRAWGVTIGLTLDQYPLTSNQGIKN